MKPRSQETISYTMSRIRGKNTGIERLLKKELTKRGIRYRCNSKFIYGHPDLSWKGLKVVVFCDSEFWHGLNFEEAQKSLKSHREYWVKKIERNRARDVEVNAELTKEGYTILRYWGKEIQKDTLKVADEVVAVLKEKGYPGI
jgi:DNA mismatch endonuclease (patch repair protein)